MAAVVVVVVWTWRLSLCVFVAQALQDPGVYGVIQSGDHKARTCVVRWIKLNSSSDDVEVGRSDRAGDCC